MNSKNRKESKIPIIQQAKRSHALMKDFFLEGFILKIVKIAGEIKLDNPINCAIRIATGTPIAVFIVR